MRFNLFDGDRAANAHDESQYQAELAKNKPMYKSIISAFNLGQQDKKEGKPYNNIFNKSRQSFKHQAYKNGYGK